MQEKWKEKNLENIKPEEVLSSLRKKMPINVCIFGVSGYTGSKLLFHLIKHKHVNILAVFDRTVLEKPYRTFSKHF